MRNTEVPIGGPNLLLLHDGELCDIEELLGDLGLVCTERLDGATPADLRAGWDLVIGTAPRMIEFEEALPWGASMRIAILDRASRTLQKELQRADIEFLVRQPVHPEALRLLFLHVLYRGPEKRGHERVSIGAPIRFRTGWRRRSGVLAELSITGCRLISKEAPAPGRQLSLQLPPEIAEGRTLRIVGTVVRSSPRNALPGEERRVALAFGDLPARLLQRLERIVELHREGPAVFAGTPVAIEDERRQHPRRALERHIPALAPDSAPVLVGRDLSLGGMRVDPHPRLRLGAVLQLAVHVRAGESPLVVRARVARDDGPRGLVLEFEGLDAAARDYLAQMMDGLPILELDAEGQHREVLVSEILAHAPG